MPKFLEAKLRAEYGNNPRAIYGTMNKLGAMKGNKETAKGRHMEKKHDAKLAAIPKAPGPMRSKTPHTGFQSVMRSIRKLSK